MVDAGRVGPTAESNVVHPWYLWEGFLEARLHPSAALTFALGFLPQQSTPSGKRYKFVATGHGKYEKVLMDEGSVP